MHRHQQERRGWLAQSEDRPLSEPPPAARIAGLLEEFESVNIDAWWRLNLEMTLEPDSRVYGDGLQPDLTHLPGWEQAEPETRSSRLGFFAGHRPRG